VVRAAPDAKVSLEAGRQLGGGRTAVLLPPRSYVLSISHPRRDRVCAALLPGSAVVVIATPGRVVVRAPIVVERGGEVAIDAESPPVAKAVPDGFIYIPPCEFLYGNASEDDRLTFLAT